MSLSALVCFEDFASLCEEINLSIRVMIYGFEELGGGICRDDMFSSAAWHELKVGRIEGGIEK